MRSLALCLMLAACATSPPPSPGARVAGCWIARGEILTTALRWRADLEQPGRLRGELTQTGSGANGARYALAPRGQSWAFCQLDAAGAEGACWQVAEGRGGSLEGGRAFIDAHRDRLRIAVVSAEGERLIFDGQRDGCE